MPDSALVEDIQSEGAAPETEDSHSNSLAVETEKMKNERLQLKKRIHSLLTRTAANERSAMTRKDIQDFVSGLSDEAFESGGAKTEAEKLEWMRDMVGRAEFFSEETLRMGSEFLGTIAEAQANKWISAASANRWRARLKEHSGNWPETRAFLRNFNEKYVQNWRELSDDLKKIEEIKKAFKVDEKTIKELMPLKGSRFEDEDFHAKRHLVSTALAALKVHMANDEKLKELRSTAEAELKEAADARIISAHRVGPWLDHIVSGRRTLSELRSFKRDWRRIKVEYNTIEYTLDSLEREPQGFARLSEEKFLLLSYEQRVSYVQEARWRLLHHNKQPKDTPIEDLKGKVRHALDIKEWDEAEEYLQKARKIATGEDLYELQSLEINLARFRTDNKKKEESAEESKSIEQAYREIEAAVALLPGSLKDLYVKALSRGSETFRCVRKTIGNVIWCADRGYLTEEIIEDSRERSDYETHERMRASGPGHGHGLENNKVTGYGQPAIRDSGVGPQNLHLDAGGEDAFVQKAEQNREVYSFWYWTNLLVKGVSINQYRFVCEALHPILSKNISILQKHGLVYGQSRPLFSAN